MIWFVFGVFIVLALFLVGFGFLVKALSYDPPPLRIIYRTLKRDLRLLSKLIGVYVITYYHHRRNTTVWKVFQSLVRAHPDRACFIMDGKTWTYQQVEHYSNRVANVFARSGYKKGDVVALFMHNRPEYVCIWLGLSRLGVVTALINTNLRSESLVHCIAKAVSVKAIVFDEELAQAVAEINPSLLASNCEFYCLGDTGCCDEHQLPAKSLENVMANESKYFSLQSDFKTGFQDKLLYIYTSGTTGLPKPAVMRNSRCLMMGAFIKRFVEAKNEDIAYNCLPMYHSAGGVIFLSKSLYFGITTVIAKKFSATKYWEDSFKYRVTICCYIGEICRFLLRQPENQFEKTHSIRLMIGSGLRHEIWEKFQERFRIPKVIEMYGSTEGTAMLANDSGKPGPIGYILRTFSRLFPTHIIKTDEITGQPVRRENGLCTLCKPGEPGIIVGKDRGDHPIFRFDGYVQKRESEKKIIQDCFKRGDRVYFSDYSTICETNFKICSGDQVVMDEEGYVYFMDRTGDTFRWRGENVSTTEVENIISKILNFAPCVVYGVQVPETEGRAGMVAIEAEVIPDMKAFHKRLTELLPNYAIPIFLRLCEDLETTGTFKLKKVDLQKEGFDITKIPDPIFFLDPLKKEYVKVEENLLRLIMEGKVRL